ncbi:substrate-binding periplasmic protein [Thalassotalea profundi]|uniref:Solute-binding protein family 3/N-terminal domain-containing protein n=1 Tax=Thalassotalea profundi TaxID=2036687 RepID=A0ABQ3J0D0_9GAMM|nr:transporter substrate-binding domain-containing protein [Thalassotalea profundi]GHE98413.1 hypothetical protein GCM10011501_29940 [Thalassotalea profundi]
MHKLLYILVFVSFYCVASAKNTRLVTVVEPPASYLSETLLPVGYVVEIVQALQRIIDNKNPIEFVPEARAINISLEKDNVLVFSLSRTAFREKLYHWVAPVLMKRWQVYALQDTELVLNNVDELKALSSIGVVRGDVREEWLINAEFKNLHSVTHHIQNVKRLIAQRVPVIVYDQTGLAYESKKLALDSSQFIPLITIKQSEVYLVLSGQTAPQILTQWQNAYNRLKVSGQLRTIAQQWQARLQSELAIDAMIEDDILSL